MVEVAAVAALAEVMVETERIQLQAAKTAQAAKVVHTVAVKVVHNLMVLTTQQVLVQ